MWAESRLKRLFGIRRSQSFGAHELFIKLNGFCQIFVNLFHALPQ